MIMNGQGDIFNTTEPVKMEDYGTNSPGLTNTADIDYDSAYEKPEPSLEIGHNSGNPDVYDSSSFDHTVAKQKVKSTCLCLRLIVSQSSILPSRHRIVLLDGYEEVQFGRDVAPPGSNKPRVRLKEMEVSKFHATVFWDASRSEWSVVDMGSKHGTFLKTTTAEVADGIDVGVRLSPSRVASMPRALHHLNRLTIGSTTFHVHLHTNNLPCTECSPDAGEEVPLFPVPRSKDISTLKRSRDVVELDFDRHSLIRKACDPKTALIMLKRSLLTRHEGARSPNSTSSRSESPEPSTAKQYIDRSARRRALYTTSNSDAPGARSIRSGSPSTSSSIPSPLLATTSVMPRSTEASQRPTPLASTNIGYRLLMNQGWEPGSKLGISQEMEDGRVGLVEPLELARSTNRVGLGSTGNVTKANREEIARHRRWEGLRKETSARDTAT